MEQFFANKTLSDSTIEFTTQIGEIITCEKNEVIFNEGTNSQYFYFLKQGQAKVSQVSIDGKETIIKYIHNGEFFGESILTGLDSYPSTATAVKNSQIIRIPIESIDTLMNNKNFSMEFTSILLHKLYFLSNRLHISNCYGVEGRFFQFLLDRYGASEVYLIDITKKEIASAIGTIPETLSRLINKLTKGEIIKWDGSELRLKNGFWQQFNSPSQCYSEDLHN